MHLKTQRRCVACRQPKVKEDVIRICKDNQTFFIDESKYNQGRGAYVCKNKECMQKAIKNKLFNRSFKCNVDSKVYEKLEEMLNCKL